MVGVEDAFPVAVGQTELELGYLYSTAAKAFDDGGNTFSRGDNAIHAGAFIAKHGFTSFLDAAVGIFGADVQDDDEPERSVTAISSSMPSGGFSVREMTGYIWPTSPA